MRRFSLGSASSRKVVVVAVEGPSLSVTKVKPDGQSDRQVRTLGSEAEAKRASEQLIKELLSRGYVEHAPSGARPAKKASAAAAARPQATAKPARKVDPDEEDDDGSPLYALMEAEAAAEPQPVLARLQPVATAAPAAEDTPKPKKKKKKKGKNKGQDDGLDKRVLAAVAGVGLVLLGGLFYMIYDGFIKPPSIVGVWRGSNTEYEVGSLIQFSEYELILDDKKRASMSFGGDSSAGTYSVKGNRLKLSLKGEEDESDEREYKIVLGRATLDLMEPETGKRLVQLIRFREEPNVGQQKAKRAEAPKDVAVGEADKGDDSALVAQDFSPKDNAFKLRPPKGWESDTGSRPDNTYSWAKFTKDSAVVQVYADVAGSLMSGSDSSRDHEEGSESAPVHVAHELYGKSGAKEEFSDFADSKPAVFKDSGMGEGRMSIFTASTGGLFGSKVRGYHATLLSRDRRVTILCYCPEKEFPTLKPLFLSVCRSFKR